jgi:hypothetical protein
VARQRPDLCVPHIELDQPDLARTQFMLDSRPPRPPTLDPGPRPGGR